jgi:hypothetical protein
MKPKSIHRALVVVALCAGLVSCSKSVTSVRLVFEIQNVQLDQLVLTLKVGNAIKLSGMKIPVTPNRLIKTSDDFVIIFPDEDAGKLLQATVRGTWQGHEVARTVQSATLVKDQQLLMNVKMGPLSPDGGPDLGPDLGPDTRPDWPVPDLRPPDQGCVVGSARCNGNTLVECKVTDGGRGEVSRFCPLGCVTSPSTMCRELVPSNGISKTFLTSGKDDLVVSSGTVTINSDTGQIIGLSTSITPVLGKVTQTNGLSIRVLGFKSIQIRSGATVNVVGPNALALMASGSVSIEGTINVTGVGSTPGPGGGQGATSTSTTAGGPGAGNNGSTFAISSPTLNLVGGGGGGGHGGYGGEGGHGVYGVYSANGGLGGKPHGDKELTPLSAGGGGGLGGGSSGGVGGDGGGGGGAIQVVSAVSITIGKGSGLSGINAGGGGGGAASAVERGGGGGGGGGAILLEAPEVTLLAGGTIAANGGGGGGGSGATTGAKPGSAGELEAKVTAGGTPSSQGGKGGDGAAGTALPGDQGSAGQAAGGGGGGAGILRLNTHSGSAKINGSLSGLFSEGRITTNPP